MARLLRRSLAAHFGGVDAVGAWTVKPPPRPRRTAIRPSRSSTATAVRTVVRDTSSISDNSRSVGKRSPGLNWPSSSPSHLVHHQLVGWSLPGPD